MESRTARDSERVGIENTPLDVPILSGLRRGESVLSELVREPPSLGQRSTHGWIGLHVSDSL